MTKKYLRNLSAFNIVRTLWLQKVLKMHILLIFLILIHTVDWQGRALCPSATRMGTPPMAHNQLPQRISPFGGRTGTGPAPARHAEISGRKR